MPARNNKRNNRRRRNHNNTRYVRRSNRRRRNNNGLVNVLTVIKNAPILTRSLRYTAFGSSLPITFTTSDFQNAFLMGISSSTTAYAIISSFKLHSVSFTLLPDASTGSGTFTFTWNSSRTGEQDTILVYSTGVTSRWTFTPPEDSLIADWYGPNDAADNLFTVNVDSTTVEVIMDLHFSYIMDPNGSTSTVTVTAPSTSGVYAHIIGGFTPVGLSTIQ